MQLFYFLKCGVEALAVLLCVEIHYMLFRSHHGHLVLKRSCVRPQNLPETVEKLGVARGASDRL
jgi:hypothetical protein